MNSLKYQAEETGASGVGLQLEFITGRKRRTKKPPLF